MERTIVEKIKTAYAARGIFLVKIHGSQMQVGGIPDLLGCWRGRFVGLEVKQPGEHATPLQSYVLKEIEKAGGLAAVVHSLTEALHFLDTNEE